MISGQLAFQTPSLQNLGFPVYRLHTLLRGGDDSRVVYTVRTFFIIVASCLANSNWERNRTMGSVPTDDELKKALVEFRSRNASLGISKLHAELLAEHPEWTVSEKRTRKILQAEGLVLGSAQRRPIPAGDSDPEALLPISKIIHDLDIGKWSRSIEVKYFSRKKGKGLIATAKINQGETIWKEDPFILAPEWSVDRAIPDK